MLNITAIAYNWGGADVEVFFRGVKIIPRTLPLAGFRLYLSSTYRADIPALVSIQSVLYGLSATSESRCPRGQYY